MTMDTYIIKYTVNGKDQGVAFRVLKKSLEVRCYGYRYLKRL
jgi:hypothetical protein